MEKKQIPTKDLVVNAIKAEPYFKDFRYNRTGYHRNQLQVFLEQDYGLI